MEQGIFTISLDFELMWGVRDHRTIENYGQNIANVHIVVPRLLKLFEKYDIHCTWATVGLLFLKDKSEIVEKLPSLLPTYHNTLLSPYPYIASNNLQQKYHFAPNLVSAIKESNGQELATHTFSHYYCLENGQNINQFEADIEMAVKVSEKFDVKMRSIVFPRNQCNQAYLHICQKYGIHNYRGTENHWIYTSRSRNNESRFRRACRLLDAYVNLSGHHIFLPEVVKNTQMLNVPSSRFLRPYSKKLAIFERIRLSRITNSIRQAAKTGSIFHLWWHPHNFGNNIEENFKFLEEILVFFKAMKEKHNITSLNMEEIRQKYAGKI
jgi:peptidoglycan/xylan/chitin deacetylase (PgdA/CDA1 family)